MRIAVKHKDIFTGKEVVSDVLNQAKIEGFGLSGANEIVIHLQTSPTTTYAIKLTIEEAENFSDEVKECILEAKDYENHKTEKENYPCR